MLQEASTLSGIRYYYFGETNLKKTLVLVMGYSGSARSWPQSMIDVLSRKYNLLLIDNRGTGKSQSLADLTQYSISMMAQDLYDVVTTLKIKSFYLLGWSLGACVALEFAHLHPAMLDKLILVSGTAGGELYTWPDMAILKQLIYPQGASAQEQYINAWRVCLPESNFELYRASLQQIFAAMAPNYTSPTICKAQLNAYKNFAAAAYLADIAKPVLVISGENDRLTPVQNSIDLASALPHAQLALLKNCEHMPHLEQKDKYFNLIDQFIA